METFKKILLIIPAILGFIGKIPVFLLPPQWKGYRTIIINTFAAIALFLQSIDIINISESICNLFNCDPLLIQSLFGLLLAAVNIDLRSKTDTEVTKSK
jgi:hypothetical protein